VPSLSPGVVLALKTAEASAAGVEPVEEGAPASTCCTGEESVVNADWPGKTAAGRRRWRTSLAPGPAAGTRRSTSRWRMRLDLTCSITKL
jgi:hypothetical protein